MCHGGTDQDVTEKVVTDFEDENGKIRVLLGTVAFGMGVDVKGTHTILHVRVPNTIGDYVQESGRVGRDGKESSSIILKYPGVYKDSSISKDMKQFMANTEECRRRLLLKSFDNDHPNFNKPSRFCCDICTAKCICGGESCLGFEASQMHRGIVTNFDKESNKDVFPQREVLPEQLEYLEFSGFPVEYIQKLMDDSRVAYPYEEFLKRCPMYDSELSEVVWSIMSEVFSSCKITDIPSVTTGSEEQGDSKSENETESETETATNHTDNSEDEAQDVESSQFYVLQLCTSVQ